MDDDRVRIHFLSKHDMFFGQVAGDASKLLESWSLEGAPAPRGVNDAVELWECHRIFREIEPGTARDEGWCELFDDRAKDAAGAAMKFLSQALAGDGFEAVVDHLDRSLVDGLLDALGSGGLAKKGLISADSFEVALCSRPWLIGLALEQRPLVKLFGEPVRRAMLANKEDSSELILSAVATSHVGVSSLALPKELTSDDVESILDAYCDCERAHINKLEVIANWKSYGGYSLSGPLRHKRFATEAKMTRLSAERIAMFEVPVPPLDEQRRIVDVLDRFDALTTSLTDGLPAEIEARRQQYEYYRDRLLDFPRKPEAS